MNKYEAIRIFRERGTLNKNCNISFSSLNTTYDVYWSNPQFNFLNSDWYLILNNNGDDEHAALYLFFIPKNSIKKDIIRSKSTDPTLMHLEIRLNDPAFTDRFSNYSFLKYKVDEIDYRIIRFDDSDDIEIEE